MTGISTRWIAAAIALGIAPGPWRPVVHGQVPSSSSGVMEPRVIAPWHPSPKWQPRPLALPTTGEAPRIAPPPPGPVEASPTQIVIQMTTPEEPAPTEPDITRPLPPTAQSKLHRPAPKRAAPPRDALATQARQSQLAKTSTDHLREAYWSARRGAFASARKAAHETLRSIALLRDSQVGDSRHSRWLDAATQAIRESSEFTGHFGRVDAAAMDRLIQVHQTEVLRHVDTSMLTPPHAIEAYLCLAQEKLVAAARGGPLAAEAMIILADVEALNANFTFENADGLLAQSALHASELSLMYRRAAVAIDPANTQAVSKLGKTLLKRSMPGVAKPYLAAAVAASPTRQNVEALQQAAILLGDLKVATQCESQLTNGTLPSELPVTVLRPHQFASTHQGGSSRSPVPPPTRLNGPSATVATKPAAGHSSIVRPKMPANSRPIAIPNSRIVEPQPSVAVPRRRWFW
ncbi:MAG: hypothetical protein AAGJ40_16985 [Planctomycetota bacterium]